MSKHDILIEWTTQDIIAKLSEELSIPFDEAMDILYSSVTFTKLSDFETGLYLESSDYTYLILKDELKNKAFIQTEI